MSDLIARLPIELRELATDSLYERMAYSHDMSPVEGFLTSDWLKAVPDVVVNPRSREDVSLLLAWAQENRIPVTPRGAGSTSLFQSVPAVGGVVVDLSLLNSIGPWDLSAGTVRVGAGTIIYDLIQQAEIRGWTLATFPSSAPGGTVGGWFNNGGRGYGSLLHGSLLDQVRGLEVVLPGGKIEWLSADNSDLPIEWFLGSEGTLGIVTELEIELLPLPGAEGHIAFGFHDIGELQAFLADYLQGPFLPFNITFVSTTSGGQQLQRINWDAMLPNNFFVASFYGPSDHVDQGIRRMRSLKSEYQVRQLPKWQAKKFWQDRYYNFRLQRTGPSLLGAEVVIPLERISHYTRGIDQLAKMQRKPMITFGYLTNRNEAYVTTMFWSDEARTVSYLLDLSLVSSIYRTALKKGGRPVGIGLWNTPYLRHIYSLKERKALWERKKRLDPQLILNPGKTYRASKLLRPGFFSTAMLITRGLRSLIIHLGRARS